MANLQVKNIPEELHAAIAARAREERLTMSQFVTRVLAREVSRPPVTAWLALLDESSGRGTHSIDTAELIDSIRAANESDPR